jgi:hypothetical protein
MEVLKCVVITGTGKWFKEYIVTLNGSALNWMCVARQGFEPRLQDIGVLTVTRTSHGVEGKNLKVSSVTPVGKIPPH